MAGNLKLKIDPPTKFAGQNFEDFSKRLRNYMCLSDLNYADTMNWAVRRPTEITRQQLQDRDVDGAHAGYNEKLSS